MKLELASDPLALKAAAAVTSAAAGTASALTADWSVTWFGVPLAVLLAGFAGAVVALTFLPPAPSLLRVMGSVATGTLAAAYMTPFAGYWLPGAPPLGLAFGIGLGAQSAIPLVPRLIGDAREIAKKRFGGGA